MRGKRDSIEFDHVTTLDGEDLARSVDVEMDEILGPNPYHEGRNADSEDEEEFTGTRAHLPSIDTTIL